MQTIIADLHDGPTPMLVADKHELLEFANKIRELGGADPILDLFPSIPSDPRTCLIATSLNFKSSIVLIDDTWPSGFYKWAMILRGKENKDLALSIGELCNSGPVIVTDSYSYRDYEVRYKIPLPEHIGNAALAFDVGLAFQEYYNRNNA